MAGEPMQYEVRNAEIEELLRNVGRKIKEAMPPGYGFTLLIFGYENQAMFYLSSAQRADMMNAFREFLQKFGEN